MKKIFLTISLFLLTIPLFSKEELSSINFSNLSVGKLIAISSKILNKNIITTETIEGKVDFISQTPISKEQLFELLKTVLDSKGYYIKEQHSLLKILKKNDSLKTIKEDESFFEIISLQNAEIKSVMPILKAIFEHKTYLKKEHKPLFSQNIETNSLIVHALKKHMKQIKELITKLDIPQLQVYVEAKIIELSENRAKNLGIKYGLSAANSSSSNIFTLGANFGGPVNALDSATNSLFTIPTQTLTSAVALGATLNLLKTNQAIDIVSEPSVLCINNKESSIYVGETKSFQTALSVTDGGNTNTTFKREDIGLTLKVKPRITTNNQVVLEIETVLEDARELKPNQVNPDTTKKEIKTTAIVTHAESVILGGLIKTKSDNMDTKTPLLGDIPILGELFNHTKKVQDKVNLVVIVTPYIIPESKDLTFIKEQLMSLKLLEEQYANKLEKNLLMNKEKNSQNNNKNIIKNKSLTVLEKHEAILKGYEN